jgi:hypothetical protein
MNNNPPIKAPLQAIKSLKDNSLNNQRQMMPDSINHHLIQFQTKMKLILIMENWNFMRLKKTMMMEKSMMLMRISSKLKKKSRSTRKKKMKKNLFRRISNKLIKSLSSKNMLQAS